MRRAMLERVAGLLVFLPIPFVLYLYTNNPWGVALSMGVGVVLMVTHVLYARPFARWRASKRCLWSGARIEQGVPVTVHDPLGAIDWKARDPRAAERLERTFGWAHRNSNFLRIGVLGTLITFLIAHPSRRWTGSSRSRRRTRSASSGWGLEDSTDTLVERLGDASARVRYHAAVAVGKLQARPAVPALFEVLVENADRDPVLRHGATIGLAGLVGDTGAARVEDLVRAREHASPFVRSAAVVALRRQRRSEVARFFSDEDPWVRGEAFRAAYDDHSIPAALRELAAALDGTRAHENEALLRRAIGANLRVGSEVCAERLVAFARGSEERRDDARRSDPLARKLAGRAALRSRGRARAHTPAA